MTDVNILAANNSRFYPLRIHDQKKKKNKTKQNKKQKNKQNNDNK